MCLLIVVIDLDVHPLKYGFRSLYPPILFLKASVE